MSPPGQLSPTDRLAAMVMDVRAVVNCDDSSVDTAEGARL